ncbi:hypothetical protein SAMD00019534_015500 [Acytostelium subglobosum LB1]|uniref:hypothetical protein n=1 Tax=Acytostelium subglobosum LB1 TaxID=1410327 RepID=UPI000644E338|nr:hypothetical protein SAMD00019534_015500 [Acytostelium subglobosum LB1]GAM18375.1 hypothetical protein SAMD00019534_015500 [Acytostelium subglobosum LB1]|eukprot:XP_012757595.1 hypothetical protein SAMD00019534_015500 [Acytostelium subglobosum LB1]
MVGGGTIPCHANVKRQVPLYQALHGPTIYDMNIPMSNSITSIEFGDWFNKTIPVGWLSASLTEITFKHSHNQPIVPGSLPPSLTKILFGLEYNQPFEAGCLPSSLTHLGIHSFLYSHDILPGTLPNSITHISIPHDSFNSKIHDSALPQSLTSMRLSIKFMNKMLQDKVFPKTTIRSLGLEAYSEKRTLSSFTSLTSLKLNGHTFRMEDLPIMWCPQSVKTLRLDHTYIVLTAGLLPQTLTHLTLGGTFNEPLTSRMLPDSLIELHLGISFNQQLCLPNGLTTLTFGNSFDQTLTARILPQSLTKLKVGKYYNQTLPRTMNTLKRLAIGESFIDKIILAINPPVKNAKRQSRTNRTIFDLPKITITTMCQITAPLDLVWCSYVSLLRQPVMMIKSVLSFFPSSQVRIDQQVVFCHLELTKYVAYPYGGAAIVHREIKIINMAQSIK